MNNMESAEGVSEKEVGSWVNGKETVERCSVFQSWGRGCNVD